MLQFAQQQFSRAITRDRTIITIWGSVCKLWGSSIILLSISSHFIVFSLMHPQNRETGKKLVVATGLMFTAPIVSFYIGMWFFSEKKYPENWAGGLSILVINVIIAGYCYSAFQEEDDDRDDDRDDSNGPRQGKLKQRID